MKKYFLLFIISIVFTLTNAQYTWVNKQLFPDSGVVGAGSFIINGMAYIVGGITSYSPTVTITNQALQYNPTADTWAQIANYPHPIGGGAAFAINGKGYIVGGFDSTGYYSSATNQYDPVADTWTPKSPFPEAGIGGCFNFVINGIAYLGGGVRNSNEHGVVSGYSYNPVSDTWSSIANFPGSPSIANTSFTINGLGYAGMGGDGNGNFFNDLYQYDPVTNSWTQVASFPAKARFANFSGFVVNGKAYVGSGETTLNGGSFYALSDYYMYDPVANTWASAPGLQGPPRYGASAISFGDSAYLIGGYNNDGNPFYRFVDEFKPASSACTVYDTTHISVTDTLIISVNVGISPNATVNTLKVYPNPAHNQLYINIGNYAAMAGYAIKITNSIGQTIFQNAVNQPLLTVGTSTWASGVYFLQILDPSSAIVETKEIVIQ